MAYYIDSIDKEKHTAVVDKIMIIYESDTEDIKKLGLDSQLDFPNGFYLYNETDEKEEVKISDDAEFIYLDWENDLKEVKTDFDDFIENHYSTAPIPYYIEMKDGYVISVIEKYIH